MLSWKDETKSQIRLALPVVVIQLGLMTMGVVDTVMMGYVSHVQFAAVGLGDAMGFLLLCFGMGTVVGFDAVFSQAFGARDEDAFGVGLRRSIVFALLISVPIGAGIYYFPPLLPWLDQPASVVPIASDYMRTIAFSAPGFLVFIALRHALQARTLLRPIVWTIVIANVINLVLDYALIFGHFGLPRLEAHGSALATTASRWLLAVILLVVAWSELKPYLTHWGERAFALRPILRMAWLGAPVGLQFIGEMGAFTLVGLWAGTLGDLTLAGHQVALKLASITFMVPLGISIAASVRVGHAIGRGDQAGVRRSVRVSLALGAGTMAVFGGAFIAFPGPLAWLMNKDLEVIAIAAALLPLAGAFQVFDGLQVVSVGILRGTADTLVPGVLQSLGFWAIGVPASWYLAFERGLGAEGLWWGLLIGLGSVAGIQVLRVFQRTSREQVRFQVEERQA
ncbi:MAG: MATE family efflux transporter [Planctomycetota bacterium]